MHKRGLVVRIVAIALAALMFFGVGAAALSALAAGGSDLVVVPTGQRELDLKWIIVVVVIAVLAIVACVIIPKAKKK